MDDKPIIKKNKLSDEYRDNRSNQLNPNNKAYWHSRGVTKPQPLNKKKKASPVLPSGTFRKR